MSRPAFFGGGEHASTAYFAGTKIIPVTKESCRVYIGTSSLKADIDAYYNNGMMDSDWPKSDGTFSVWYEATVEFGQGKNFRIPTHRPSNFLTAAPTNFNREYLA